MAGPTGQAPSDPDGSCPFTAAELAGVVGGSWREVDSSIDDLWASETEHPSVVCHYEAERDDAEMYVTTVKVIASDAEEARSSTAAAAC